MPSRRNSLLLGLVLAFALGVGLWVLHALGRAVTKLLEAAAAGDEAEQLVPGVAALHPGVARGQHHPARRIGLRLLRALPLWRTIWSG